MHTLSRVCLVLLLAVAACKAEQSPPPETTPGVAEQPPAPPSVDARTPFDFAQEWSEVYEIRDANARYQKADAMGKGWEGRIYTWTGYAMADLCQEKKRTCVINVFERTKTPKPAYLGGFYPKVEFTAPAWLAVHEGCKGQAQCIITFKSRLATAQTEMDKPLKLEFVEADVKQLRQPQKDEIWFRSQEPTKLPKGLKKKPLTSLRTGKPTVVDIKKLGLKSKTF